MNLRETVSEFALEYRSEMKIKQHKRRAHQKSLNERKKWRKFRNKTLQNSTSYLQLLPSAQEARMSTGF